MNLTEPLSEFHHIFHEGKRLGGEPYRIKKSTRSNYPETSVKGSEDRRVEVRAAIPGRFCIYWANTAPATPRYSNCLASTAPHLYIGNFLEISRSPRSCHQLLIIIEGLLIRLEGGQGPPRIAFNILPSQTDYNIYPPLFTV